MDRSPKTLVRLYVATCFASLAAACGGAFSDGAADAGDSQALVDEGAGEAQAPPASNDASAPVDAAGEAGSIEASHPEAGGELDATGADEPIASDARDESLDARVLEHDAAAAHDAELDSASDAPTCAIPTTQVVLQYGSSPDLEYRGIPQACACDPSCSCLMTQTLCDTATYSAPETPQGCLDQGTDFSLTCAP